MPLGVEPSRPLALRLAWLGVLYLVQGLPAGFQATALPAILRIRHVPLAAIGFAGVLALPWMLKLFWAPWVDRYGSARIGRRKTWILPLQLGLAASLAAAAFFDIQDLWRFGALILAMNFFAATLDVPVDGLAVDTLAPSELGLGNAIQVVGFKVGMLIGGGVLLWLSDLLTWSQIFLAMALLVLISLAITLAMRESPAGGKPPPPTLRDLMRTLWIAARQPGALTLFFFIATYKLGESAADAMFKPFLVDAGFDLPQIGLWVGTWGMGASILGSFAGGFLAFTMARSSPARAVLWTGVLRVVAMIAQLGLTLSTPTPDRIIAVTVFEHFAGGALTAAMFTLMMSKVDRRIGATHFTLLATIEVLGKVPGGWLSGVLTERIGYSGTFGVAAALSAGFLLLAIPIARQPSSSARQTPGPD